MVRALHDQRVMCRLVLRLFSSRCRASAVASIVAIGIVLGAPACATNPVSGKREFNLMPESQEIAIAVIRIG